MSQTVRGSAVESIANVVIGYVLACITQAIAFPLFGIHVSPAKHLGIGAIFVAVSLARSFAIRRAFVWLHERDRPVDPPRRKSRITYIKG